MSKYRVTECPGCGLPFREGRSLSQHFIWSPRCKQQANSFPHHVSSSIPHQPILSTSRFMSGKHCSDVDDTNDDRESLNSSMSILSIALSYPDADTEEEDIDHAVAPPIHAMMTIFKMWYPFQLHFRTLHITKWNC